MMVPAKPNDTGESLQALLIQQGLKLVIKKVAIGVVILALVYVGGAYVRVYFWEKEAARYMEQTLIAVAQPWSEDRMVERASLALQASGKDRIITTTNAFSTALGSFVRLSDAPSCHLDHAIDTYTQRKFLYAFCSAKTEFEKGTVKLNMRFAKQDKKWLLDDFQLER